MNNIILYISNTNNLNNPEIFKQGYETLIEERQKKVDEYKFFKDKVLSLGAGLLLQKALEDENISIEKCQYKYNEHKKPYIIADEKIIHFNLSHSGEYVICAISNSEVGCDIEKIETANFKTAKRFFSKNEYEIIMQEENLEKRNGLFYRFWTLKESFIKAAGIGLSLPLNKFQIILQNEISIIQNFNKDNYYFTEYNEISGYKCAVCSKEFEYKVKTISYTLP